MQTLIPSLDRAQCRKRRVFREKTPTAKPIAALGRQGLIGFFVSRESPLSKSEQRDARA